MVIVDDRIGNRRKVDVPLCAVELEQVEQANMDFFGIALIEGLSAYAEIIVPPFITNARAEAQDLSKLSPA